MILYLIAASIVLLAVFALRWLGRPIWYPCENHSHLESFLADLVSEQSPWPVLEIHNSQGLLLSYRRAYAESGPFRLFLERPGIHAEPQDLGLVSAGNIGAAADAGRRVLRERGIRESEALRLRYQGPMDQRVVSKARFARDQSAV